MTLNHAGNEVLIKAVRTVILTYARSEFSLTKTWSSEINAMIAEFWFGRSDKGRKIH